MQPLTRHGHRGHAVFVLPARPRRAAGAGRQPHPPCEKRAQPQAERPARHIAAKNPASRAKIWANHTPCHAAPPAAPRNTLGPAAMPGAPPRPAAKNTWASRHAGRTTPPRRGNSPVSRTPHAAPPSPRLPRRREKVRSATRRAMPQADRGPPKRAPYGSHTAPRPAAQIVLLVAHRTPRPHRPACRAAAKSPAKHPTGCTPSQNTRPRPYGRGRVPCLSVSFLPPA